MADGKKRELIGVQRAAQAVEEIVKEERRDCL
jgi:hypothetical protein